MSDMDFFLILVAAFGVLIILFEKGIDN